MYLSKLVINTGNPLGLRSIVNQYEAHRTIWRGFPDAEDGGPGRVLFRLEHRGGSSSLAVLVQSRIQPDWQPMIRERLLLNAEVKELTPEKIQTLTEPGRVLRFRLRANPTKRIVDRTRVRDDGKPHTARVGLFGEDKQQKWLQDKALQCGFCILECRVSASDDSKSRLPGGRAVAIHKGVTFDGVLQVTDSEKFREALESGIGSAKGFGFGLLSVAPVR